MLFLLQKHIDTGDKLLNIHKPKKIKKKTKKSVDKRDIACYNNKAVGREHKTKGKRQ
jgi:hypothetical protein